MRDRDTRQGVSDGTSLKEGPQAWAPGRRGQGRSPSKRHCLLVLGRKLGLVCRCPRNLPPALCPLSAQVFLEREPALGSRLATATPAPPVPSPHRPHPPSQEELGPELGPEA